jgi:hypothetical protein
MALSKSEVLALIPTIPPPYVSPYEEYTIVLQSDGATYIGAIGFLINQIGDSSQDGVNDILWSLDSVSSFSATQTSAPFITTYTDAKPITFLSDAGDLLFAVPTFVSTTQITYDLYFGDGTQPVAFPAFTGTNVLLTIRVFV